MADLDHRYMEPPFLRIVSKWRTQGAETLFVWDLRVGQPNVSQVTMPIVHSLEHFLGSYLRGATDKVVNVAPMGCQTGFYIVAIGIESFEEMSGLLADALASVGEATRVPLADSMQCGWAENHSLRGAQEIAAWLLVRREAWCDAGPKARERTAADPEPHGRSID